jgi:hypothetical protein
MATAPGTGTADRPTRGVRSLASRPRERVLPEPRAATNAIGVRPHPGTSLALLAAALALPAVAAEGALAPLEPCAAAFPAGTEADPRPEGTGAVLKGRRDGHVWAHARGYVHGPLRAVWGALHDPAVSQLSTVQGRVVPEPAPSTPIAFRVDYRYRVLVFDLRWQLEYRGGALAGSLDRLDVPGATIGFRFEKIAGTPHIRVLSASLVARETAPGVTALELVVWLDADRTGEREAVATATQWFDRIVARVHAGDEPATRGSAGP